MDGTEYRAVFTNYVWPFTDTTNPATLNVVSLVTPTITWPTPSAITYGTALSGTQLDATTSVAGTFTYTPAAGAILPVGNQTLSVLFSPTDTTHYTTATKSVTLKVNQASTSLSINPPASASYAQSVPVTATISGGYNPSGTVTFQVYDSSYGCQNSRSNDRVFADTETVSGGQAGTTYVANDGTGTYYWVASYSGDGNNGGSSTSCQSMTVTKVGTTVTTDAPSTATYGDHVSVTATVNGGNNPTGGVQFGLYTDSNCSGIGIGNPVATDSEYLSSGTQVTSSSFSVGHPGTYYWLVSYAGNSVNSGSNNGCTQMVVSKKAPTVSWANPAAITYGTALSNTQLNATASVPGNFAYTPGPSAVLGAGSQTLSVTFTPSDTTDYSVVTEHVTLMVNQAPTSITWATPASITYGTLLGSTQLDAAPTQSGNCVYTPAAGTLLSAGDHTLSVTCTPTDTNYSAKTATTTIHVDKATPAINWTVSSPITYGTGLGNGQLHATSPVAGTFAYTLVPSGTTVHSGDKLDAGTYQIEVTFTPYDAADYNSVTTASQTLVVNPAQPHTSWYVHSPISWGTTLSAAQLGASATDGHGNSVGTFTYQANGSAATLGEELDPGNYTLTATLTPTNPNYAGVTLTKTLVVNKATPNLNWWTLATINYGTSLSSLLDATATGVGGGTLDGSFSYTEAPNTILDATGLVPDTIGVTFTPTDTTHYSTASSQAYLWVLPVQPTVTPSAPASVTYGNDLSASVTVTGPTGGKTPTGNVTFKLYPPTDPSCSGKPVYTDTEALSGGSASSGSYTSAAFGDYHWAVSYDTTKQWWDFYDYVNASSGCNTDVDVVGVAPTIVTSPSDTTVTAGNTATFTASATGIPSPSVKEWDVSTDGGTTWTALSSSLWTDSGTSPDSSTLTLTGVTAGMNGYQYQAVFTNSVSPDATTKAATLTVQEAPIIVLQPSDTTVAAGSDASFTAGAVGLPSPTVQWQSCPSTADCTTPGGWSDVANATSTTLSLTGVTPDMDGSQYRAVFSNLLGSTYTDPATLTVTTPAPVSLPGSVPNADGQLTGVPPTTTPGETFTATGTGFAPYAPVTFGIYSSPVTLAHVSADASGTASASITIPSDFSGDHTVVAAGMGALGSPQFLTAGTTVVVSSTATPGGGSSGVAGVSTSRGAPGPNGGSSSSLANTGTRANPIALTQLALLVMLAGAGMLLIGRRRQARKH